MRYLSDHASTGVSPSQIRGWASSIRKNGMFTHEEIDHAFRVLAENGLIAYANDLYYRRGSPPLFGSVA